MVLPTTAMTPAPSSSAVIQHTRRSSSRMALKRSTQSRSSCTESTSGQAATAARSASSCGGEAASAAGRTFSTFGSGLSGQRIQCGAEARLRTEFRQRLAAVISVALATPACSRALFASWRAFCSGTSGFK